MISVLHGFVLLFCSFIPLVQSASLESSVYDKEFVTSLCTAEYLRTKFVHMICHDKNTFMQTFTGADTKLTCTLLVKVLVMNRHSFSITADDYEILRSHLHSLTDYYSHLMDALKEEEAVSEMVCRHFFQNNKWAVPDDDRSHWMICKHFRAKLLSGQYRFKRFEGRIVGTYGDYVCLRAHYRADLAFQAFRFLCTHCNSNVKLYDFMACVTDRDPDDADFFNVLQALAAEMPHRGYAERLLKEIIPGDDENVLQHLLKIAEEIALEGIRDGSISGSMRFIVDLLVKERGFTEYEIFKHGCEHSYIEVVKFMLREHYNRSFALLAASYPTMFTTYDRLVELEWQVMARFAGKQTVQSAPFELVGTISGVSMNAALPEDLVRLILHVTAEQDYLLTLYTLTAVCKYWMVLLSPVDKLIPTQPALKRKFTFLYLTYGPEAMVRHLPWAHFIKNADHCRFVFKQILECPADEDDDEDCNRACVFHDCKEQRMVVERFCHIYTSACKEYRTMSSFVDPWMTELFSADQLRAFFDFMLARFGRNAFWLTYECSRALMRRGLLMLVLDQIGKPFFAHPYLLVDYYTEQYCKRDDVDDDGGQNQGLFAYLKSVNECDPWTGHARKSMRWPDEIVGSALIKSTLDGVMTVNDDYCYLLYTAAHALIDNEMCARFLSHAYTNFGKTTLRGFICGIMINVLRRHLSFSTKICIDE